MRAMRTGSMVFMLLALSACAATEPPSRGGPPLGLTIAASGPASMSADAPLRLGPRYRVADVRVEVPRSLRVSEANVFYPIADIVWREEARGDRHAQVQAIVAEGLGAGVATMTGDAVSRPAVIVEARVTRFHSLTEKTRYTIGGVHALHFVLTVRDAATGSLIEPPRAVVADVRAAGGSIAIAEEATGRTQRVVITERLASVIRRELSMPVGLSAPFPDTASRTASTLRLTPGARVP